ncbi:MAG: PAS domain-containing protein [Trichodesmium sp.]
MNYLKKNIIFDKKPQISLQRFVFISLITPILITLGFVGWISLQRQSIIARQIGIKFNRQIGNSVNRDLDDYLGVPDLIYKINQDLIKSDLLKFNDLTDTKSLFIQQIEQFNVSQINFGTTDGNFVGIKQKNDNNFLLKLVNKSNSENVIESTIDLAGNITQISQNSEYNYQTESWYQDVIKSGKPISRKVDNSGDLLFSYPLYNQDNSLIGVLRVDLPTSQIEQLLEITNISQLGVIYLIEKSGLIVASSLNQTSSYSSENPTKELAIPDNHHLLIQEISNKLLEQESHFNQIETFQDLDLKVRGKQYFVTLLPMENQESLDLLIVVALPVAEFIPEINQHRKSTILFYLLPITIAIYLAILISRWVTKPIYTFLKAIQNNQIIEGDLSLEQEIFRFTEIEELVKSFNQINEDFKNNLRESDRWFNISLDLIAIVGTDGYFKKLNPSWSKVLGYSIEELLAIPYINFVHPEDRDVTCAKANTVAEGDQALNFQNRYLTKDGSYRWFAWNSVTFLKENLIYTVVRDITDQKKYIEQLFMTQRKLIEAEKIAGIGSWEYDLTTGKIICSEQLCSLFGLASKSNFSTAEDYLKLVHPDDLPEIKQAIKLAINQGESYKFDQRICCPNGELKHILITGKPIFNEIGKIIKLFTTVLDITERKKIEIALRESQEKFTQLAENINSVFWMRDYQSNQILYISPNYKKIWGAGYSWDDLYSSHQSFLNAIHPEDSPQIIETLTNKIGEKHEIEYRIVQPNGEIRWIWDRAFPIKNEAGVVYRIAGIAEDITDEKIAEAELKLSQERLQLALEASGDGLWDWNISTGEYYFDRKWLKMLDYDQGDLSEDLNSWEMLIHPEDQNWVMDALNLHLEDSSFIYAFDYRLRTKSGEWRWIATYGKVVVRDKTGKPLRMIGTHQDISDRKAAEVTLQKQLELEKLVSSISTRFINFNPDEIDSSIHIALQEVSELTGADRSSMFLVNRKENQLSNTHEWCATGIEAQIENQQNLPINYLPWLMAKLQKLEVVHIPLVANLPLEATREKQILSGTSIKSLLCIPMVSGLELIGFLRFDVVRQSNNWGKSTINLLKIIGEIFVSALDYQEAELALRESEQRFRIMADSAPVLIWMSGTDSLFTYFNQTWLNFTGRSLEEELGNSWQDGIHPEDVENYREIYQTNFQTHQPFTIEYRLRKADGEYRWVFDTGVPRFHLNQTFTGYIGSCIDISDRKQAEVQIQKSLAEKEILLKEIHHRVKNNLHIISNLLDLQSDYIEDQNIQELFADSQNRIQTMALIHEQLYQSKDLGQINFREYLHTLMDNLLSSYYVGENMIQPIINVEPITLNLETAIPCGLLINELVTNSLKYAFPNGESGEICVELYQDKQQKIHLTIKDNGIGIDQDFDWQNSSSLGLKLVQILSKQLKAEIKFDCTQGTVVNLIFLPLKYKSRF